jgi:DNA-directed RNA polymerase sigma subunit (sigma70/sigma32)
MVRQHVRRYNASTRRAIRLPEYIHTQVNKVQRAWAILKKQNGGVEPSDEAIDAYNEWPAGTTKTVRDHHNTYTVSVNNPLHDDERLTLGDIIASPDYAQDDLVNTIGDASRIERLLSVLSPRSREVVERYFGLGDFEAMNAPQIAEVLGVSKQRAHQILVGALKEMGVRNGTV